MRPLLLLLALTAACAPSRAPDEMSLVVGRASDALRLDPALITDTESAEVCEAIYEHLVRYRPGTSEIEPALAESWEVSPQGTEWTFHLRRGVRFHDGTPFDADAVVFSFDRQRDPNHPFHRKDFSYWDSTFRNIVRVEKVDAYTVRIVIDRPYAPFRDNLSMFPVSIVSPAAVRRWGEEYWRHPVGTGPFRFFDWTPGDRVTLVANSDYWGGAPRLSRLVFAYIRDARQRLVDLEGGSIDVAENLAPQDLQFVALHPELRTAKSPGNNVGYLAMNLDRAPFNDPRVRRAVAHAIDRTPIVKLVYQGLASAATGPLPPSTWGQAPVTPYATDPDRARALLEEAGYDHALRPKLYVMSTPRIYMPAPEEVARIIQGHLHEVGIDVELVVNPIGEHLRATGNGEHDLCLRGWSADNRDPDNFLYVLFAGENAVPPSASNVAFVRDARLSGLLRWAQETSSRPEREQFYREAQYILHETVPWVPLAHAEIRVALRRRVAGLDVDPSGILYFQRVIVEAGGEAR